MAKRTDVELLRLGLFGSDQSTSSLVSSCRFRLGHIKADQAESELSRFDDVCHGQCKFIEFLKNT